MEVGGRLGSGLVLSAAICGQVPAVCALLQLRGAHKPCPHPPARGDRLLHHIQGQDGPKGTPFLMMLGNQKLWLPYVAGKGVGTRGCGPLLLPVSPKPRELQKGGLTWMAASASRGVFLQDAVSILREGH